MEKNPFHQISYGIIPLKKGEKGWQVFVIFREKGFWEFPKGHPEPGESPKDAAIRELYEETALNVEHFLADKDFRINYEYVYDDRTIQKSAVYFIAVVRGDIHLQQREVLEGKWVSLDEAEAMLSFENLKKLYREVVYFLQNEDL